MGATLLDLIRDGIGDIFMHWPQVVALFIAWQALHVAAAVNLRNKRVDVISSCNQRYDALSQIKTSIITEIISIKEDKGTAVAVDTPDITQKLPKHIEYQIELYHRRYWGLKSDQIDYWLAGHIDPETLISWFMSTMDAIHKTIPIWSLYTSNGGWKSVRDFHRTTNFRLYQVVESILSIEVGRMEPKKQYAYLLYLFRTIEVEEKALINFLKRESFQRLWMDRFRTCLPKEVNFEYIPHVFRKIRDRALSTISK